MTKEEKIICKDFLNDADKTHSCNEYKLLMALLDQEPTTKNNLVVDAVSRQAINGYIDYILSHGMGKKKSFDFIKKFVANLPSVTPIRAKGHWKSHGRGYEKIYMCDNCKKESLQRGNYCPNCGADMREVEE